LNEEYAIRPVFVSAREPCWPLEINQQASMAGRNTGLSHRDGELDGLHVERAGKGRERVGPRILAFSAFTFIAPPLPLEKVPVNLASD